jgi:hypothetical protein
VILYRNKILNNYYIDINLEDIEAIAAFLSENYSGKTAIIKRLLNNIFYEGISNILVESEVYNYEYNIKYELTMYH